MSRHRDSPCPEQLEVLLFWSTSTQEAMLEYLIKKFSLTETKSDPYKGMSGSYKIVTLPSDKLIFLKFLYLGENEFICNGWSQKNRSIKIDL